MGQRGEQPKETPKEFNAVADKIELLIHKI
jgi:hypothetical protein